MSRRARQRGRGRSAKLRRRQISGVRNMAMALVALGALLALGGTFADGAAGCFSQVSHKAHAPLELGGDTGPKGGQRDESRGASFRVKLTP